MSRFQLLTDDQWALISDKLPHRTGKKGRPFSDPRLMLEGIIYRIRCGIPWRELPECFGSWQTVYHWHNRMAKDGTFDEIVTTLIAAADHQGLVDWSVSIDSTISRAHQHATNITRHTGGFVELQQSADRAA